LRAIPVLEISIELADVCVGQNAGTLLADDFGRHGAAWRRVVVRELIADGRR
jgi:hypothetical protein